MKAWGDLPGDDPEREKATDRAETAAAIEAAGIDLHPPPPGSHRHDDPAHPSDHAHPHLHAGPGQPPIIGIVGAGAVGTALGVALTRGGWPIHAVASRDAGRRERFRSLVDVTRVFADPEPILDEVELIVLAVPDDVIGPLAALAPDVQRPGDDPHQRRARGRGPRPGHGRRDADRLVPSAGRLRRHRAGRRRAPRRDRGDRRRRPAGRDARRHGRGRRCDGRPPRAGLEGGLSRGRGPGRRRASWPSSTPSPSLVGWPGSTRPARWRSTARSSRARSATPGRSGSGPR